MGPVLRWGLRRVRGTEAWSHFDAVWAGLEGSEAGSSPVQFHHNPLYGTKNKQVNKPQQEARGPHTLTLTKLIAK